MRRDRMYGTKVNPLETGGYVTVMIIQLFILKPLLTMKHF